jgi:hypothetical protein
MAEAIESKTVLEHLERDLGQYTGQGVAKPESGLGFSLLQFADRPSPGVTATVTFGLSTHLLRARDGGDRREELLVLLREEFDEMALQIVANVGSYALGEHIALSEGETVGMPKDRDSDLDRLVVARPEPLPDQLARCDDFEPPVEFFWLLPSAGSERHMVVEHGWRELLAWIDKRGEDPYDLRRAAIL